MKDFSETLWKWQYKLCHPGSSGEKTLDDYSSIEKKFKPATPKLASFGNPSKDPTAGSTPCIKTLYEGPASLGDGRYDWVDYPPKQLSKSAAQAEGRIAIRTFKVKDKSKPVISGRHSLQYHQIELRNPLLMTAVAEVFKKKELPIEVGDVVTFHHPFRSLFYAYDDLAEKREALADSDPLGPFLLLLVKLLDEVFAPTRVQLAHLRSEGRVSWDLAWAFLPYGTSVMNRAGVCDVLCKVIDTEYKLVPKPVLVIKGKLLRFNGEEFAWDEVSFDIDYFAGHKPMTELDVYPLDYFDDPESLKKRLIARGKRVLDYQGMTYCEYQGIAVQKEGGRTLRHNVNGRILIDVVGHNKHYLGMTAQETMQVATKAKPNAGSSPWKRPDQDAQDKNRKKMLEREEDLIFLSPLLEGYALANKIWCRFFIDDIGPLVWNEEAYDHLVYDTDQKDMVLSFVESHDVVQPKLQDDVILGKGQGLIVLLSGPPGTGKTLTAEAVADRTRRPLFYLQAEDLGINPSQLGAKLKKIFEMATEWGGVILLDEADVFMAERHPQDIARNELVSIFLRELEYFSGIIFLTTNLYSTIDSAFRSRVSLHLIFKPLSPDARVVVWRKFLGRLPPSVARPAISGSDLEKTTATKEGPEGGDVIDAEDKGIANLDEDDLKELGAWNLNGREIKTAVKMARAWCDHKGHVMTRSRLENSIKATSPHASKLTHEGDVSIYDN